MGLIGSLGGFGASLAGGILAGNAANKGYRQQQEIFNKRLQDIKAHRDALYYQDPTQSATNQAAVTEARDLLADQAKQTEAAAAVTGGTPEAVALEKAAASKAVGDMMQKQAVQGEARKDAVWADADDQIDAYSNYLASSKLQQGLTKAKNISEAAGALSNQLGRLPV